MDETRKATRKAARRAYRAALAEYKVCHNPHIRRSIAAYGRMAGRRLMGIIADMTAIGIGPDDAGDALRATCR